MIDDSTTIRVTGTSLLTVGQAKVFPLPDSDEQGFVIRTPQGLRAYRNRCRHWRTPLDMDDADFWNAEVQMIQCKVHGAIFRPGDGVCVFGPCPGAPLLDFPLVEEGADSLVTVPAAG